MEKYVQKPNAPKIPVRVKRRPVRFSAYITTRDGRRIYASEVGIKAFPLSN